MSTVRKEYQRNNGARGVARDIVDHYFDAGLSKEQVFERHQELKDTFEAAKELYRQLNYSYYGRIVSMLERGIRYFTRTREKEINDATGPILESEPGDIEEVMTIISNIFKANGGTVSTSFNTYFLNLLIDKTGKYYPLDEDPKLNAFWSTSKREGAISYLVSSIKEALAEEIDNRKLLLKQTRESQGQQQQESLRRKQLRESWVQPREELHPEKLDRQRFELFENYFSQQAQDIAVPDVTQNDKRQKILKGVHRYAKDLDEEQISQKKNKQWASLQTELLTKIKQKKSDIANNQSPRQPNSMADVLAEMKQVVADRNKEKQYEDISIPAGFFDRANPSLQLSSGQSTEGVKETAGPGKIQDTYAGAYNAVSLLFANRQTGQQVNAAEKNQTKALTEPGL